MGGKKSWNANEYASRQHGGSWGYWRGSYQARSPKNSFPTYDQSRMDPWQPRGREPEATEAPTFTQALQGSLNGTRKMEQRVASLQANLARRQELWEVYLRDMKEALRREQARFARDMDKLRTDLEQAVQNQEAARGELLRVAALAGRAPEPSPPDTRMDRLFAAWCAEDSENDAQAILRRAMAATGAPSMAMPAEPPGPSASGMGAPPGLDRVPAPEPTNGDVFMEEVDAMMGLGHAATATLGRTHAATPAFGGRGVTSEEAYPGIAARDPYLPSPGQAALRPRGPSASPRTRPGPYGRTGEAPATGLADPVAAALAATRAATPFGVEVPTNVGSLRSIDPTRHPVPTLIEDDDELTAPTDPGGTDASTGA